MNNRYFTKFCGITTIEDALNAQVVGCDALGFVFANKSKRKIQPETCNEIINKISPNLLTVALFANNSEKEIKETLKQCSVHVLQFHGDETPEFCQQWQRPYWKAIPMADEVDALQYAQQYDDAQGYLIDNYGHNKSGGSGNKFNWQSIPQDIDNKWILAGGLNPENIAMAKNNTSIVCFDVSSGIETSPGLKCKIKMNNFIRNLND